MAGWFGTGARAAPAAVAQGSAAESRAAELALKVADRKVAELAGEVERLRQAESELLAAKREAEAAALAKGEFLATMSHEIRTPLNGILPILELVLARPLEDEIRHQVSAAFESAREMRRIVNDVLDYSKLQAGAMQFEIALFKPAELIQSVISLMKRSAETKNVRLSCEIHPGTPPTVRGDALRLRQLVTNLVGNAIKFTQRGEVVVEVSQLSEDRTHRTLRVVVKDTGIGIAPEAAARLFQPFSQAETSMARTHGGTGLGLAICHRIVDGLGGTIGVESAFGRGSSFWFNLPFLRATGEAPIVGAEKHALLLTRDEQVKDGWERSFTALDIRVTHVTTAYEALACLRSTLQSRGAAALPDLVAVDMCTAAKTAASLTRPLLTEEGLSGVKVLLLGEPTPGLCDGDVDGRIASTARGSRDAAAHRAIRALLNGSSQAQSGATPTIALSDEPPRRFDGLRVLLVDDIPINLYAGKATLEKLGCVVSEASGGREAVELLRNQRYDVVLMDCQMPDVDGFSATRIHRLHEKATRRPPIPILAVTANAMPGDRERCLEAGMNDHLAKPISLGAVSRMLNRWVGHPEQAPAGEENPFLAAHARVAAVIGG